jgi:hypothetical protein
MALTALGMIDLLWDRIWLLAEFFPDAIKQQGDTFKNQSK